MVNEDLQHVLDNVLRLKTNHFFRLCIEHHEIASVEEILCFTEKEIRGLQYTDDNGFLLGIKSHGIGMLLLFKWFMNFYFANDVSIYNDWRSLSEDDFH